MPPPRPASGDTIYVMYAYEKVTITVCPCWPASTTNKCGLVTLTFDLLTLKVVSESRVTWATSVPILVFLGLSVLVLGPMYATDRQTDVRQHHRLMPPGRGIVIYYVANRWSSRPSIAKWAVICATNMDPKIFFRNGKNTYSISMPSLVVITCRTPALGEKVWVCHACHALTTTALRSIIQRHVGYHRHFEGRSVCSFRLFYF